MIDPRNFQLIDAFRESAYVLSVEGDVVYANHAAEEQFDSPPRWLHSVVKRPASKIFQRYCVVHRLEVDGIELHLVLLRPVDFETPPSGKPSMLLGVLPPSLTQIAKLLMMGMSDKEIARCSGLTIATVRTYTGRIYRRLGVGSRQELLALALTELGFDPTPTPLPVQSS